MTPKSTLTIWILGFAALSEAQPIDRFEVASIRPSGLKPGELAPVQFDSLPGSRIIIRNLSLRFVIAQAFGVRDDLIQDAPAWLAERYNIEATGNRPKELTDDEFKPALRTLLKERLNLVVHWGTQSLPGFSLLCLSSGAKLKKSDPTAVWAGAKWFARNKVSAPTITMELFAKLLSSKPDLENRIVVDHTGLAGNFDIDLEWRPDSLGETANAPPFADLPSIFEVLERLGLKLVATKVSQPVLMIDRVERPSEN